MTLAAILIVAFVLGIALRLRASLLFTSFFAVVILLLFVFGDAHRALDVLTPFVYPRGGVAVFTILATILGYMLTALVIERLGAGLLLLVIAVGAVLVVTWPWPFY